jgi:hypothetical protein
MISPPQQPSDADFASQAIALAKTFQAEIAGASICGLAVPPYYSIPHG